MWTEHTLWTGAQGLYEAQPGWDRRPSPGLPASSQRPLGLPDPRTLTAGPQKLVQAGHGVQAYLEGQVGCQEEEGENQQGPEEATSVACG